MKLEALCALSWSADLALILRRSSRICLPDVLSQSLVTAKREVGSGSGSGRLGYAASGACRVDLQTSKSSRNLGRVAQITMPRSYR